MVDEGTIGDMLILASAGAANWIGWVVAMLVLLVGLPLSLIRYRKRGPALGWMPRPGGTRRTRGTPIERATTREVPEYAQVKMATVTLRLDAQQLENPDLDLRYAIPGLLSDRSNGLIRDGGYDYETDHVLLIYLQVDDAPIATALIEEVLREVVILDNHLAGRFTLRSDP